MARIFSSGFELNSTATNVEWSATVGSPTIQTSTVRTGTYAGQIASLTSSAAKTFRYQFASGASNGPYWVRVYARFATLPSAENRIITLNASTTVGSTPRVYMTIDNLGVLRLYDEDGQITGTTTLSLNLWHCIEIHLDFTAAAGSHIVEARVNLAAVFATSSTRSVSAGVDILHIGGNHASEAQTTGSWFFDDVGVNDSTTSNQNSWLGRGSIIHLLGNASGDANTFATQTGGTAGAGNNYTRVNEVTPNDATSFNGSNTLNQEDLFNFANTGFDPRHTISVVSLGCRFRNSTADAVTAITFELEKTGSGTKSSSSAIIPNTTTWNSNGIATPRNYPITLYADPDNVPWSPSSLDSLQAGYKLTTGGTNRIDVSTVWILVEYVNTPISSIQDLFNQTTLNTNLWAEFTAGSATTQYDATGAQANYPAVSTSSTDGDVNSGNVGAGYGDLTGSFVYLQVLTVPSSLTSADAELRLTTDSSNWLRWVYEAGTLYAQYRKAASNTTVTSFAYNSSTHKYWQIRESGGTIYWDTSSDGITFTNRGSVATPIDITGMYILIAATCFQNEVAPGAFKWNNLSAQPPIINASQFIYQAIKRSASY